MYMSSSTKWHHLPSAVSSRRSSGYTRRRRERQRQSASQGRTRSGSRSRSSSRSPRRHRSSQNFRSVSSTEARMREAVRRGVSSNTRKRATILHNIQEPIPHILQRHHTA